MNSKIVLRDKIRLSSVQEKMIKSGWGEDVIDTTIVESITYLSDGLKVKGYIAYPKATAQKHPCIIWCRGGLENIGAIDKFTARGMLGQIASCGYVVFASQYRGNDGGEGKDEFGGNDINDVLNLIPLADEISCADKNIWGIEGWSRGGMMTYLTLTKTNIFKSAITVGGIARIDHTHLAKSFVQKFYELYTTGTIDDSFKQKCEERSILNFPKKLSATTPILLMHGDKDEDVCVNDSIELANKLKGLQRKHELVLFEDGDHFLKDYRNEVHQHRIRWFDKYLKNLEV